MVRFFSTAMKAVGSGHAAALCDGSINGPESEGSRSAGPPRGPNGTDPVRSAGPSNNRDWGGRVCRAVVAELSEAIRAPAHCDSAIGERAAVPSTSADADRSLALSLDVYRDG